MLVHQALPFALLAAGVSALPCSTALLKRAEPLPAGVNHSLEVSVGNGSLTQCSPVNITWSAAVQPEGEAGGPGGNYTVTLEATRLDIKARLLYEQRTFTPDEPRVWTWPVDVPAEAKVRIMVSSFENGNVSHHDGDVWYGAIPDTNVTLGSYDDACIPDANRPVTFDESQLSSIRSCEPTELTWSGSAPPYEVWIYTQNTLARPDAGLDRISLGTTNETSITWDVDFPAGLAYFVEVQAADSLRSYAMNAAVRIEGETGNCTIPEQHELINPISAASLSSVASSFWVLVPSVLLWMAVA